MGGDASKNVVVFQVLNPVGGVYANVVAPKLNLTEVPAPYGLAVAI